MAERGSAINLAEKLQLVTELWSPRVVAELNDYQVKIAKLQGEFLWHAHDGTDELFLVLHGELRIEFRDRVVELGEGELCVVPAGVEHRPVAERECHLLLIEPRGTVNTGNVESDRRAESDVWI